MASSSNVQIRFFLPPEHLRRYFTTFYLLEVTSSGGALVTDWLHPEWGNLRFCSGSLPVAEGWDGAVLAGSDFPVTGPSNRSVKFTIGSTCIWGIGLLPLGWAQFMRVPASRMANVTVDGRTHTGFEDFLPLAEELCGAGNSDSDVTGELTSIGAYFDSRLAGPVPDEERIVAIHNALIDPDTFGVAELVERVGASERTVERICDRTFGFPPRMLLRRQRFMRSLAQFMLDPSLKWIDAIDSRYHDQAQFVRDFRAFMGMTPRQYAAMPKPILSEVMRARTEFSGAAVQTFDRPEGGGPPS